MNDLLNGETYTDGVPEPILNRSFVELLMQLVRRAVEVGRDDAAAALARWAADYRREERTE